MAGNKKPRGMRVTPIFRQVFDDDGELVLKSFNTKRVGQRLGKNTRLSDLERTKNKRTHTSPVTPVPVLL